MPGFRITNCINRMDLKDYQYANLCRNELMYAEWKIQRSTLNKFQNDKILFEDDRYIILLEGVVLNSTDLQEKYKERSWLKTIMRMIADGRDNWFGAMEGPVSGAVLYKEENKWVVFTGHLGEKAVFYWNADSKVIIGSKLHYVTDLLREEGIERPLNETAMVHLMAYDSLLGNETCVQTVKRLYPGHYLVLENHTIYEKEYSKLDDKQDITPKNEGEYIDRLDYLFRRAMQRIIDKNRAYGYMTVADISGGYDSRLNCYVLKDLGAENVILDCYAQSGSHDFRVSNAIATELGYDYVFRSLDNASCMYSVEDNVRMLNGATSYAGITGGRDMLRMLRGLDIGLEVTGLLGDVHDGSMVTTYCDAPIDTEAYRDSQTLIQGVDFLFPKEEETRFQNHVNEHYWFYNRGMIAGMSSFFIRQNFTEAVTPFGDLAFMCYYLSIPWEIRVKGKLLRKWLAEKYPSAGEYTNGRNGLKLKRDIESRYLLLGKVKKNVRIIKWRMMRGKKPRGMNDVEYWYRNNKMYQRYVDDYLQNNQDLLSEYPMLQKLGKKLEESGTVHDKMIMMTILAVIKCFVV